MEKLMRIPMLILTLLLASCEYFGFDGYINQLEEIGINHELADAVSLGQHLVSRPREFNRRVYVLGTRGVYVLRASKLSSYRYYPYSQDLGYERDFWEDRLPPINCYRDPVSGRVIINALHEDWDRGLRYGDTLTLDEDTQQAVYTPADPSAWGPLVSHISESGSRVYVLIPYLDTHVDSIFWSSDISVNPGGDQERLATAAELFVSQSPRTMPQAAGIRVAAQKGSGYYGKGPAQIAVYTLTPPDWISATGVSFVTSDSIFNDRFYTDGTNDYYAASKLNVSVNNRYILLWGDALEDKETMLVYDYLTGERKLKTDIPGNETVPELAESGMDIFVTSIRGGVARYAYD
jgi:hypothetical protein